MAALEEVQDADEDAFVTFTLAAQDTDHEESLTLLERRHLVVGSKVTGFTTWQGALHLASYLVTDAGSNLIKGCNVLELGAGTGLLAILCSGILGAQHVTATDGDPAVVESMKDNLRLNDLLDESRVYSDVLRWGCDEEESLLGRGVLSSRSYDVVLGADIVRRLPTAWHHDFPLSDHSRPITQKLLSHWQKPFASSFPRDLI